MTRLVRGLALRVLGFLIPALLELMLAAPLFASAQQLPLTAEEQHWIEAHPVVRVGVSTEFPPYYFSDTTGRYEGFVIDLMDRLAQHTGLRFEYRRFARFGDALQALQARDIDLTPFTSESDSRREYLRFVRPLFSTQMVIVADRRLGDVTADETFSNYRVAVEKLSTAADLLSERYPQARVQIYDTAEQALLATAAGDADLFISFRQVAVYFMEKHLTANLSLRGTLATPGTALGPAVRKDLPELASILDKAVTALSSEEIAAITVKWMPRSVIGAESRPSTPLTSAQRDWVKRHGGVSLGFDGSFSPIAFANTAGGFDGLAADITRLLSRKAGLIVSFEKAGSFSDVVDRARRGEIDMVVGAARNAERSKDFDFVGPFLRVPTVVVAPNDKDLTDGLDAPGVRRVALLRQHFLIPLFRSRYPKLELIEFESQAEALQALRTGKADLAIGNMKVVNQLLEARHAGALRTIGIVPQGDSELYFAVRKTLPELADVLRAAFDSTTPAELAEIENRWLRVEFTVGIPWQRAIAASAAALSLVGLILGSFWFSNRRLRAAQRTLQQARGMAEEQVAARASFTAYLTHELRGTLSGLASGLSMLEKGDLPDERRGKLVSALRGSAAGLLDLCERTLDFERWLKGGVDLNESPAVLADVVANALAPWRVQAELKGLAFQSDLDVDPKLQVKCDPVRLTQVLQNLVGNAVKFTARGEVRVRIGLDPAGAGVSALRIEVADTGPGIGEAERSQLFKPFSQGQAGRRSRGGAGLGLSIAAGIVKAMHGTLRLERSSGDGSLFVISMAVRRLEPAGASAGEESML